MVPQFGRLAIVDGMQSSVSLIVSRRSVPNWFATKTPVSSACFACAGSIVVPLSAGSAGPQPLCSIRFFAIVAA